MKRNPFEGGDGPSEIYPRRPFGPPIQDAPAVDMYEVTVSTNYDVDLLEEDGVSESMLFIVTFAPSQGSEEQAVRLVQERFEDGVGQINGSNYLGQYQLGSQNYRQQLRRADHVIHNHEGRIPSPPDWDNPPIFWY